MSVKKHPIGKSLQFCSLFRQAEGPNLSIGVFLEGRRVEIGSKIKKSRIDAKLTQEQAAEALGISRQTISNCENEKSYPDIVSVLKMSDLYGVSLDYLLKGDSPMKNYLDHIEESTNVVKSKVMLSKLILTLSYLVIWAFNIMVSWFFLRKVFQKHRQAHSNGSCFR